MDRDPQAITDDVADLDAVIQALDPQHFWKLLETTSTMADSGFTTAAALTVNGSPTRGVATGLTGILGVQFAAGASLSSVSITASTTTFSILAVVKMLAGSADQYGTIIGGFPASVITGLQVANATRQLRWAEGGSSNFAEGAILPLRQAALVGLVVTAGVPQWYVNGVPYETDDASTLTSIASVTPDTLGDHGAGTTELNAVLSRVAYLPGVALTEAQMAAVWSARFSCHTATLAIVNKALGHLGENNAVTNLSTDTTARGVAGRLYYATAVESVLRAFAWPFANRYETLTLVGGTSATAVNSDWQYSYRVPDRMVRALRIVKEGQKRAHDPDPIPFRHEQDALGGLIYTDQEDAELEFTIRPTCPANQGDVWFREALSWVLASLFVPTLSKNERTVAFCLQMADVAIQRAAAGSANEEEPQDTNRNDPSWIVGR